MSRAGSPWCCSWRWSSSSRRWAREQPGVDDVWIVWIDGTGHHLDAAVASVLRIGEHVSEERCREQLTVDGEVRPVSLSGDARAMLYLSPAMRLLCVAVALPRRTSGTARGGSRVFIDEAGRGGK